MWAACDLYDMATDILCCFHQICMSQALALRCCYINSQLATVCQNYFSSGSRLWVTWSWVSSGAKICAGLQKNSINADIEYYELGLNTKVVSMQILKKYVWVTFNLTFGRLSLLSVHQDHYYQCVFRMMYPYECFQICFNWIYLSLSNL